MARNEGARKTGQAIVQSIFPDICWTPLWGRMVPVPYNILARLDLSVHTDSTVKMTGFDTFTMSSRVTKVIGDEAGTGGGIFSGVNLGYCRPMSHSPTVRAGKSFIIYHSSIFGMNCDGPAGTPNTFGKLVYVQIESFVWLDEDADFLGPPFVGPEGMSYDRFDAALDYIYDEMVTNANSSIVELIHSLNHPGWREYLLWQNPKWEAMEQFFFLAHGPIGPIPAGPWDHKPKLDERLGLGSNDGGPDYYFPIRGDTVHEYYYDIWSNIHYGYVGSAAGFDPQELLHYAASGLPGVGASSPSDDLSTQIGIDLWEQHGTNLTKEDVQAAIEVRLHDLLRAARAERAKGDSGVAIRRRNGK